MTTVMTNGMHKKIGNFILKITRHVPSYLSLFNIMHTFIHVVHLVQRYA